MKARRFGGGRLNGRRLAKALLAAVPIGFLAWWSVQAAMSGSYAGQNPYLALRFNAADPEARFELAMIEFSLRNGRVDAATRQRALAGLARAPLAEEPFLLGGLDAAGSGRNAASERLFAEAVRRNPRFRAARLLLLNNYLQAGDIARAGVEMAVLDRLIPQASNVLVDQVAGMVGDPARGAALMRVLEANPAMQQSILARLASKDADPGLILRIASAVPTAQHGEAAEWQRLLVSKLVERGRLQQAHRMWLRFNGLTGTVGEKGVHDGGFKGAQGGPPFGWTFTSAGGGVAERTNAGLQIDYYGRETVELAGQLLLLKPGTYRLQFRVEGDASGEGSNLGWTIACVGDKRVILDYRLAKVGNTPRMVGANVTVPSGCAGQNLTLYGRPDEFPTEQNALIGDLDIRPARPS